ncbi:MAG: hypothetical protein ACM3ZE_13910 [Myxococcales bacterium]
MLWLYRKVGSESIRRAIGSWPAALSLIAYALILVAAAILTSGLGMLGSLLMGLVSAACWSSYLELISQAVIAPKFRVDWSEFKRTFLSRFGDVISVMFAFWILSFVTIPLTRGPQGAAISAMIGFAIAFFFNAVPELLYQGNSRSFALLVDSGKFVMEHPVVWLLPNVLLAGAALLLGGGLSVEHPAELLILFGSVFSSPGGIAGLFYRLPYWAMPLALFVLHFAMVFRGLLFRELASGRANPRWREFQNKLRH